MCYPFCGNHVTNSLLFCWFFFWRILEALYNDSCLSRLLGRQKKHALEESFYSALKPNHFGGWEGGCLSCLVESWTHYPVDAVSEAGCFWEAVNWLERVQPGLSSRRKFCADFMATSVRPLASHPSGERTLHGHLSWASAQNWKRAEGRGRRAGCGQGSMRVKPLGGDFSL